MLSYLTSSVRAGSSCSRRRGSLTVEMAMVLPLVLAFILAIFEYGRYIFTVQLFNNAAREGTRYAVAHLQPVTLGGVTYGNATSDVTSHERSILSPHAALADSRHLSPVAGLRRLLAPLGDNRGLHDRLL